LLLPRFDENEKKKAENEGRLLAKGSMPRREQPVAKPSLTRTAPKSWVNQGYLSSWYGQRPVPMMFMACWSPRVS